TAATIAEEILAVRRPPTFAVPLPAWTVATVRTIAVRTIGGVSPDDVHLGQDRAGRPVRAGRRHVLGHGDGAGVAAREPAASAGRPGPPRGAGRQAGVRPEPVPGVAADRRHPGWLPVRGV